MPVILRDTPLRSFTAHKKVALTFVSRQPLTENRLLDDLYQAGGHMLREDLLDLSGIIRVTPGKMVVNGG